MKYITTINENEYLVEIIDDHHVRIDGKLIQVDFQPVSDQPVYSVIMNGLSYEAFVYSEENAWQVMLHGYQYSAEVEDERERRLRSAFSEDRGKDAEFLLKAPMPGLVVSVAVIEGQQVSKGDLLIILESMKMQNELRSPRDGVISRLRVDAGDSVEQKQTMLTVV